jgi:hypothetical protein
MKYGCTQDDPREDLKRKDHSLDIVGVTDDQSWSPSEAFRKKIEYNHSSKENKCKLCFGPVTTTPFCLEDHAEDKGVNG